jgi:hypothetical protein
MVAGDWAHGLNSKVGQTGRNVHGRGKALMQATAPDLESVLNTGNMQVTLDKVMERMVAKKLHALDSLKLEKRGSVKP